MKVFVNASIYFVLLMALASCQSKDLSSNTNSITGELETFKLFRYEDAPQIICSIDSEGNVKIIKNSVGQYDGVLEMLKEDQISKSSVDELRSLLQAIAEGEIVEYMESSAPTEMSPVPLSPTPTFIRPISRLTLLNHIKLNQVFFGSHSAGGVIMNGPNSEKLESLLNNLCSYPQEEVAN